METSAAAPVSGTSAPSDSASEGSTDKLQSQEREVSKPSYRVMPSAKVQPKGDVVAFNAKRAARAEAARAEKMALHEHALATRNARSSALHKALLERELQAEAQRSRALSAPAIFEQSGSSVQSASTQDSKSTEQTDHAQPTTSDTPAQATPSEMEETHHAIETAQDDDSVCQLRREVADLGESIMTSWTNNIRLIYGMSRRFDSSSLKLEFEIKQLKRDLGSLQCAVKGVVAENARLRDLVQNINHNRVPDRRLELFHARVVDAVACFDDQSIDDL